MQLATLTLSTLRLPCDRPDAAQDETSSAIKPNKKRRWEALSDASIPAAAPYLQALLHQPASRLGRPLTAPEAATTAVKRGGRDHAEPEIAGAQEKPLRPISQPGQIAHVVQGNQHMRVMEARQAIQDRPSAQSLAARPLRQDTAISPGQDAAISLRQDAAIPLKQDAAIPLHPSVVSVSPETVALPRAADPTLAEETSGARNTQASEKRDRPASTTLLQSGTVTGMAGPLSPQTVDATASHFGPSRQLASMPTPAPFAPLSESAPPSDSRRLTYTFRRTDPTGAKQVELLIPRQMPQPVTAMVSSREVLERLDVAIQQADAPPLDLFEKQGQQRRGARDVLDDEEET